MTCPVLRYHPGIVAQKAATMQILSGGRSRFGLGAGENPNEHVVGQGWPSVGRRHETQTRASRSRPRGRARARAVPLVRARLARNTDLPNPQSFEDATQFVRPDDVGGQLPCGADVDEYVKKIRPFVDAGFTESALVQIGADQQQPFFRLTERELLPALREL